MRQRQLSLIQINAEPSKPNAICHTHAPLHGRLAAGVLVPLSILTIHRRKRL